MGELNTNKIISNLITGQLFAELKKRNMDKSQITELGVSPEQIYLLSKLQLVGISNNTIKSALEILLINEKAP